MKKLLIISTFVFSLSASAQKKEAVPVKQDTAAAAQPKLLVLQGSYEYFKYLLDVLANPETVLHVDNNALRNNIIKQINAQLQPAIEEPKKKAQ